MMLRLSRLAPVFSRSWSMGGGGPRSIVPFGPHMGPLYLVGDVHGCLQLYKKLEDAILADARGHAGEPHVVLLGDIIDRGPASAGLLDFLLTPRPHLRPLAVMGNHEAMMLAFLDQPHRHARWLYHGGFETLRSYGLALTSDDLAGLSPRRVRQMLAAYVPENHVNWLRSLPDGYRVACGDRDWIIAHAGYDANRTDDDQTSAILHWGQVRPDETAPTGLIHGHTVVPEPEVSPRRINLDTGAYLTGTLTACRLLANGAAGDAVALLSLRGQPA